MKKIFIILIIQTYTAVGNIELRPFEVGSIPSVDMFYENIQVTDTVLYQIALDEEHLQKIIDKHHQAKGNTWTLRGWSEKVKIDTLTICSDKIELCECICHKDSNILHFNPCCQGGLIIKD